MKGGVSERTQGGGRPGRGRARRGTAGPDRRHLRPLRRRRSAGRLSGHGEQARPARARVELRRPRPRGRSPGRVRHPLAHLLDDQADHLGRRDDAVRGGRAAADRPGQQVHPVLRRPARLRRRLGPEPAHGPGDRADAGLAPAHPHLRAHLRLPPGAHGRRDLPRGRIRPRRAQGHGPGGGVRRLGVAAAAVRAGRGMELRRLHRRPRPGGRGRLRAVARRVLRRAHPRPARHDRHHLLGRRRPGVAAGRAVRPRPRPEDGQDGRRRGTTPGSSRGC